MAEDSEVGDFTGKIIGFPVQSPPILLDYDVITKAEYPAYIFQILENKNLLQKSCQRIPHSDK
ncbi:MAG: hypothetical protein ACOY3U_11670 [Bacillota bacterium]